MATLTDIINDPSVPKHLREQIAQAQIDTIRQEAEVVKPAEGDLAELVGGRIKVTREHAAGTGRMVVYAADTGEPRDVLQYMVPKMLAGGKFTLTPTKEYKLGNVLCYLHPDHPGREALRAMGFDLTKDCGYNSDRPPAAHLASEYDRDQHMAHRHGTEWAAIQRARDEQRRQEQVDMQMAQIEAMKAMAGRVMGPEPVVAPWPTKEDTMRITREMINPVACGICGREFSHNGALALHKRGAHKEGVQS